METKIKKKKWGLSNQSFTSSWHEEMNRKEYEVTSIALCLQLSTWFPFWMSSCSWCIFCTRYESVSLQSSAEFSPILPAWLGRAPVRCLALVFSLKNTFQAHPRGARWDWDLANKKTTIASPQTGWAGSWLSPAHCWDGRCHATCKTYGHSDGTGGFHWHNETMTGCPRSLWGMFWTERWCQPRPPR